MREARLGSRLIKPTRHFFSYCRKKLYNMVLIWQRRGLATPWLIPTYPNPRKQETVNSDPGLLWFT